MEFTHSEEQFTERHTVLICIPSLLIGGTEIQTLYLARAIRAWGLSVVVACYYEWSDSMIARFRNAGAEVVLFSEKRCNHRPGAFRSVLFLGYNFLRLLSKKRFAAVHLQYMTPAALPLFLLKLMGVKLLFATVHQSADGQSVLAKLLLRASSKCCTRLTTVSRHVAHSWFQRRLPKNVTIIPNTIDIEQCNWLKKGINQQDLKIEFGIQGRMVMGVVARLSFIKGIDLMLDAFATLSSYDCNLMLVVVGGGKEFPALQLQAQRLLIADRVLFLGEKAPDEAFRIMQMFDIAVCPSRYEGFGLSVLEAQASGKPVVAFDTGGVGELIRNEENGLLVKSGSVPGLVQACMRLIASSGLREMLALNAAQSAARFDFKHYGAAIRELCYIAVKQQRKHSFFSMK